jgi:hypothetical protein
MQPILTLICMLMLCMSISYGQQLQKGITTSNKNASKFYKYDVDPSFPDGTKAWEKFLAKHLVISVAISNGAPTGVHNVKIEFEIDETGLITKCKPLTKLGYGMEDEPIRVIKKVLNGYLLP